MWSGMVLAFDHASSNCLFPSINMLDSLMAHETNYYKKKASKKRPTVQMAVQVIISLSSASPSSQLFSTSPMASRRGRAAAASISLQPRPQPVNGRLHPPLAHANLNIAETEHDQQPRWWEKSSIPGHDMIKDINSTEELLSALVEAGDRLVVVEFYAPWCAACKALFPKLCKTAEQADEVVFLKVNFEENKGLCKRLNIRVLPYFHFYRGAHGKLDSFSCSLLKFKKLRDAIALHKIPPPRASGSPKTIGDLTLESVTAPILATYTPYNESN